MERKKSYHKFEFGNVVPGSPNFAEHCRLQGTRTSKSATPRYSRERLMCGVRKTC